MTHIAAQNLDQGDRIIVSPDLVRTFCYSVDTGMVNRRNVPILAVYYAEGDTPEWGCGNTWAADSLVEVTSD